MNLMNLIKRCILLTIRYVLVNSDKSRFVFSAETYQQKPKDATVVKISPPDGQTAKTSEMGDREICI